MRVGGRYSEGQGRAGGVGEGRCSEGQGRAGEGRCSEG